jgi:DNA-binding transcriptional regulator YdaS (Cro superfamily)
MDLHSYLSAPGAPCVSEFRKRMLALGYDVKSDAQIRQWRYGYGGRLPSPENCVGIWRASGFAVGRQDLRPTDYWLIWPDLAPPAQVELELGVEEVVHE